MATGRVPVIWLLDTSTAVRPVHAPIDVGNVPLSPLLRSISAAKPATVLKPVGMVPVNLLIDSSSDRSAAQALMVPGMVPDNWLTDRSRLARALRALIDEGRLPVSEFVLRLRTLCHPRTDKQGSRPRANGNRRVFIEQRSREHNAQARGTGTYDSRVMVVIHEGRAPVS